MNQDELFSILQGFAALTPTKYLEWPSCSSVDALQDFLINQLIYSEQFRLYPPSDNYQKSFWKWVIGKLEERDEEVREEIYFHYLALLDKLPTEGISPVKAPPPSYVTYVWRDTPRERFPEMNLENLRKCTLFEARTIIESGTTGLRTWSASFVLAEYLLSHTHLCRTSRVLELGSGAGFLGIILAQMQIEEFKKSPRSDAEQPSLCLTDLEEKVLKRCESNVMLPCNAVLSHPDLRFKKLDWSDALDEIRRGYLTTFLNEVRADLILGADLVYVTSTIRALVAMLRLSLTADQTTRIQKRAIIAATVRNEDTLREFTGKVQEASLRIEEIRVGQDGISSHFLRNQPDMLGESRSCVKLFLITDKVADS